MVQEDRKRPQQGGRGSGPNKKGKYWTTQPKKADDKAVPHGAVGILATCEAGRERRAVDETVRLVEDALSRLGYEAPEKQQGQQQQQPAGGGGGIDALLAAEVAELNEKRKAPRFRYHDTGVKGTLFIAFPTDEPDMPRPPRVVEAILDHVDATKQLPARYLLRLLPVTHTCFVAMEEVKAMAAQLVASEPGFAPAPAAGSDAPAPAPLSFAVEYEHRSCNSLPRLELINAFVDCIPQPPHKVNLSAPDRTILVQLIRNVCTAAVTCRYRQLSRYNVRRAAEEPEEVQGEAAQGQGQKQAGTEAGKEAAEAPKEAENASQAPKEAPKEVEEAPKEAEEAPKEAEEAPKEAEEAAKKAEEAAG